MSDKTKLLHYLSSKTIQYTDNKGYRQCLRNLFNMNPNTYAEKISELKSIEDLDEETEDEISYDCEAAEKVMEDIFSQTKGNEIMDNIYSCAAARMFSEDMSIGLAVLFSYDYMPFFYLCLVDYLKAPNDFNKNNNNYINLMKKIS